MTAKAETDEALEKHTDEKASSTEELMGNGVFQLLLVSSWDESRHSLPPVVAIELPPAYLPACLHAWPLSWAQPCLAWSCPPRVCSARPGSACLASVGLAWPSLARVGLAHFCSSRLVLAGPRPAGRAWSRPAQPGSEAPGLAWPGRLSWLHVRHVIASA